jgi:hypothetical protein
MKTIKEAAKEYADKTDKANAEFVAEDFTAGVEYAQRWISVKDELPQEDNIYLVKWTNLLGQKSFELVRFSTKENNWEVKYFECVTHWRAIELK